MASSGSTAAVPPSSSSATSGGGVGDSKYELLKQMRSHEVSVAELNSLSSSRGVYQKNGNIFFRTSIQKAVANEQRLLALTKAKIQQLDTN